CVSGFPMGLLLVGGLAMPLQAFFQVVVLPQACRPATGVCVRKVRQLNLWQLDVRQVRQLWQATREPWTKSVLGHLGQGHALDGFALALAQNEGIDLVAGLELVEGLEEFARL